MNQEIARRERELESTVKAPATAERYRIEKTAEGQKKKVMLCVMWMGCVVCGLRLRVIHDGENVCVCVCA